jgi:hypothetical protein
VLAGSAYRASTQHRHSQQQQLQPLQSHLPTLLLCYCQSASLLQPAVAPTAGQSSQRQTQHQCYQQLLLQLHAEKAWQQQLLRRERTPHEMTLLLLLLLLS